MSIFINFLDLSCRIVLGAAILALLVIIFRIRPELNKVMYPYYKEQDSEKVGFINFKRALQILPIYRYAAYYRLIIPLFGTAYLFILLLFDYHYYQDLVNDQKYIYFMTGAWGLCLVQSGSAMTMLAFAGIPFGVGFLFSGSLFGGYVATVVVLALFYAFSFEGSYVLRLFINKIEIDSGKTLNGDTLAFHERIFRYLRLGFLFSAPASMIYTLIKIVVRSEVSTSGFNLRYVDFTVDSLITGFPLILIYANISIMSFGRGGIFKYLQEDLFAELGKRILFKMKDPQGFKKQEEKMSEQIKGAKTNRYLPVRPTDRPLPLNISTTHRFRVALTFFSLDALLTVASVLGIKFIPGVDNQNIHTLSSLLKIPLYVVFLARSANRVQVWFAARGYAYDSETLKEETESELRYYRSVEQFLLSIQKQQVDKSEYFSVSGNKYLLSLAGYVEVQNRIHV